MRAKAQIILLHCYVPSLCTDFVIEHIRPYMPVFCREASICLRVVCSHVVRRVNCRYNKSMRTYTTHYIADVTDDEETTVDEW